MSVCHQFGWMIIGILVLFIFEQGIATRIERDPDSVRARFTKMRISMREWLQKQPRRDHIDGCGKRQFHGVTFLDSATKVAHRPDGSTKTS